MAFQAMNHGLEARATSSPRIGATHNLRAERVLVFLQPLICGYSPTVIPPGAV